MVQRARHDRHGPQCDVCGGPFRDDDDRDHHEIHDHFFCFDCDRMFANGNAIKQHLHSRIHRRSSVVCPFCRTTHGTATGLVHHLERGSCPNAPLNRETLYHAVRRHDPHGVISKKLLEYPVSHKASIATHIATERAWNPQHQAYQCYMCHRLFGRLASLNQHLDSPIHKQMLYHCPNRSCGREFSTLAAAINHLESESCGFMRFHDVQTNVSRIVNPNRMIGF